MNEDLKIAQEATLEDIYTIAEKAGIDRSFVEPYGNDKAKIDSRIWDTLKDKKDGKLILVTAINPTPAGEGKSTTTIGLADGLSRLGKKTMACLREPSLGPVFGLKGGAAGGGHAQVVPMEAINLHFTGDMHAITTANNLISAVLDNSIYQGNPLNIDPEKVVWPRCMDMNDRTLRSITIAQDKKTNGVERKDHFVITVATEVMAILCLSKDLKDFQNRIAQCIVAYTYDGKPVTVKDLNVDGAAAVVMREAIKPNLVQTLEHTPVLIHGGPFANIAHGCNSIIATRTALKLADYVVTEAGFGADLGAEKFLDIKCRLADLKPNAVVIVATIRALKMHGGVEKENLGEENVDALIKGAANLQKHIESIQQFHLPYVVAINKFTTDTQKEIDALFDWCRDNNHPVRLSEGWAKGGEGTINLAKAVIDTCAEPNSFAPIYDVNAPITEKIEAIAKTVYGARNVEYSEEAQEKLKIFITNGWDHLPICMAKTPLSLTDDAKIKGRPEGFTIHVRDLSISRGAGFVIAYTGAIMTMPGLPKDPAAVHMGIDEDGNSYGIF
ncbi:MAG: formate--tetrahydrofolate ligase [Solobacterium sp.]|jgi:formate--tetrahydrofolate ligase|nr:formate--tetrahydrofolate ligase [Solobacterium sp.]MCH4222672.1 formate--tetrahydrofolate ligase [Solobacterium sp.]MCH4265806.1 formate--tetrahydrofolate ligase [Solobacterium sp.]